MRRGSSSEEEPDNSEEDEDFQDDSRDSEEEPPKRRVARPKEVAVAAPRSEPPHRKLIQSRMSGNLTATAPRTLTQARADPSLLRKRKIEFIGDSPAAKRIISATNSTVRQNSSPAAAAAAATVNKTVIANKENNASAKKAGEETGKINSSFKIVNVNEIIKPKPEPVPPVVAASRNTRRTLVTPASQAAAVVAATRKADPEEPDSLIQVRRTTPLKTATVSPSIAAATGGVKQPTTISSTPITRVLRQNAAVSTLKRVTSPGAAAATTAVAATPSAAASAKTPQTAAALIKTMTTTPVVAIHRLPQIKTAVKQPATDPPKTSCAGATVLVNSNSSGKSPVKQPLPPSPSPQVNLPKTIRTIDKHYVLKMPPDETALSRQKQANASYRYSFNLTKLANNAKSLQLPSDLWSFHMQMIQLPEGARREHVYRARPKATSKQLESYDIQSFTLRRQALRVNNGGIQGRRKQQQLQKEERDKYDRQIRLQRQQFTVTMEDKEVRLVGAPDTVTCESDLELLLQVVDHVSLQSLIVEPNVPMAVTASK